MLVRHTKAPDIEPIVPDLGYACGAPWGDTPPYSWGLLAPPAGGMPPPKPPAGDLGSGSPPKLGVWGAGAPQELNRGFRGGLGGGSPPGSEGAMGHGAYGKGDDTEIL